MSHLDTTVQTTKNVSNGLWSWAKNGRQLTTHATVLGMHIAGVSVLTVADIHQKNFPFGQRIFFSSAFPCAACHQKWTAHCMFSTGATTFS
jgi:hypothetical protein